MGTFSRIAGAGLAVSTLLAQSAGAQDSLNNRSVALPAIDVSSTRTGGGITGASTSVITAEDLERAPESSLQDILSREAGIQTTSLYGSVNGTGTTVDMRGFGVTAPSNVLVLVDGRRFNDSDLTGFDFSLIPRNSIERIEITRGNSGAVLYGDGAVGGVINVVTKNGVGARPNARVEAGFGSYNTREAKVSASTSFGPFSTAVFGNAFETDGYRDNNRTKQRQAVGDIRYKIDEASVFFNIAADHLDQHLPGPRTIADGPFVGNVNEFRTNPRGTNYPLDKFSRDNIAVRGGFTRSLWDGIELTLDGSLRRKDTTFATFNPIGGFLPANTPSAFNETTLSAASITPRVNFDRSWGDWRVSGIAGVDFYKTNYQSNRALFQGAAPNHVYDFDQTTTGFYAQPTFTFRNDTDVSLGGRIQRNSFSARDTFDPTAPAGPFGVNPQGLPLDTNETQRAVHVGIEHRFSPNVAVFARMAQSFRLPNIDERVGATPVLTVTDFNLRTQRSRDYEGGLRLNWNRFDVQTSVYDMYLTDELHFSPITFANTNLDPTRRYGVETMVRMRVTDSIRLRGSATHTRAVFRSGPFAGNDVTEVARWTGSAGASWDVYQKYLMLDVGARFVGKRYPDGDEANLGGSMIPAYALVDVRVGGEIDRFFWSFAVQNLFDKHYYDYALDQSFAGNQLVQTYPQPGRTFMMRAGAKF
ncbi:MAG: TonB-dependent receptor [Pseudolabrys sp.]|nr:TonB-dependent receptor [Pseudolabrys sp.]